MKNWNDEIVDTLPQQTRSEINATWHNLKHRVNNSKHYADVDMCDEWQDFVTFARWVVLESNFESGKSLALCRLGDRGDYTPENCVFRSRSDNTKESNQIAYIVYYSGAVNLDESREVFFGLNVISELSGIKYSTLHKYVDTDKFVTNAKIQPFKIYKL